MFIGVYQNSIDAKNRVVVPAKFREELGYRCILTKGLDECLVLYPMETWQQQEELLSSLPRSDQKARKFIRFIYANAVECDVDRQGRITVPNHLRDAAGVDKELMTIGFMDRVEIWAKEVYENSPQGGNISAEDLAEIGDKYQV